MQDSKLSLVDIIEQIESKRLGRMNLFETYEVGMTVKHKNQIGKIVETSHKGTSVVVEFADKKRIRFFTNKKQKNIGELSLHKIISEVSPKKERL